MRPRRSFATLALISVTFCSAVLGESSRTAQQATLDGNRLLAEGEYSGAARAYGEAIELDPHSYSSYYKRATAYLSLGRNTAALDDFDTILRLNPAFVQAYYQKAKILAKEGEFSRAGEALELYLQSKDDADARELAKSLGEAEIAATQARKAKKGRAYPLCVQHATRALETGPNSIEMREVRVACAEQMGDVDAVYGDLSRLALLQPASTELPLRLAHIAYFILASPSALNHVKQCLHYDPDSKPCKKVHRLLRSLEKDTAKARNFAEGGTHRQAIKILDGEDGLLARFDRALKDATTEQDGKIWLPPTLRPNETTETRLHLYALACKAAVGANDFTKRGMKWCDETFAMDENNSDALIARGEKALKEDNFQEAVRMFEKAFEVTGRSSQEILNRVQKAQRLLKVSKQKDYYKVLGVPRDADERTIKKAFRTAAKIAHPDVGGSEEKMANLNEAYEVLSTPELRQRYDNGDDPNDPTSGQQQNPFAHHGGMPFQFFQQQGGGGFPGSGGGQRMQFQWG